MFLHLFAVATTVDEVIDALLHPEQLPMPDKMQAVLLSSRFGGEVPPEMKLSE
jgi:hypothetical protein